MIHKRLAAEAARLALRAYHGLWRPRLVRVSGALLWVPRGVFIPVGTVSTGLLAGLIPPTARGRLLDIGCGSGALAVAAALRGWRAVCYEPSPAGLRAARVNAALNRVEDRVVVTGDAGRAARLGPYDLVVSNPPYLPLDPLDALDTLWCAGARLEALRDVGLLAATAAPGAPMLVALSTLTPPARGLEALRLRDPRLLAAKPAGLDVVQAYIARVPG